MPTPQSSSPALDPAVIAKREQEMQAQQEKQKLAQLSEKERQELQRRVAEGGPLPVMTAELLTTETPLVKPAADYSVTINKKGTKSRQIG